MDHKLLVLHLAQQLVDQHEGQLDLVGDVAAAGVAAGQQELQDQGLHFAVGQVGRAERCRLDRREDVSEALAVRRRRLRFRSAVNRWIRSMAAASAASDDRQAVRCTEFP